MAASAAGLPLCMWALATGQPCPGCGMTRAALALTELDWSLALQMNPTAPLTVPAAVGLAAFFAGAYVYDGKMRADEPIPRAIGVTTIVALTAVYIARAFGAFGGMVPV